MEWSSNTQPTKWPQQEPIALNPQSAPAPISFSNGPTQPILPPEVQEDRAGRYSYGFKDEQHPTIDEIRQAIYDGKENDLRQQAASVVDAQKATKLQNKIADIVKTRPLSPSEVAEFSQPRPKTDPASVFENAFSTKFMSSVYDAPENGNTDSWFWDFLKQDPASMNFSMALGQTTIEQNLDFLKHIENLQTAAADQGMGGYLWNLTKQTLPFYTDARMRGFFEDVGKFHGLLGDNLAEQRLAMLSLPSEERAAKTQEIADYFKDFPQLGIQYFSAMLGQSDTDYFANEFQTLIDATTLGSGAKGVAKGVSSALKTQFALNYVKAAASGEAPSVAAAAAAGDIQKAGIEKATTEAVIDAQPQSGFRPLGSANNKAIIQALPSYLYTEAKDIRQNPGKLGQAFANMIATQRENLGDAFTALVEKTARIQAVPDYRMATRKVMEWVAGYARERYPEFENQLLDTTPKPIFDRTTGGWYVENIYSGPQQSLFASEGAAKQYAEIMHLPGATIEEGEHFKEGVVVGRGFGIRQRIYLPQDADVIRNAVVDIPQDSSPLSWTDILGEFVTKIRTPEETMARMDMMNAKVATYIPNVYMKFYNEHIKAMKALERWKYPFFPGGRSRFKDFKDILNHAKSMDNPITKEPGYFFKTPGEVDEWYKQYKGRYPSEGEVSAYFQHTAMNEIDHQWRAMAEIRNLLRDGADAHQLFYLDKTDPLNESRVASKTFNGTLMKNIPTQGEGTIASIDKYGKSIIYSKGRYNIGKDKLKDLNQGLTEGRIKVIRLSHPDFNELDGFAGIDTSKHRIEYVITDNVDTKPIDFDSLINRRGGGHIEYDHPFRIVQPGIMREIINQKERNIYRKDNTLHPMFNRAEAQGLVKHLNASRELINSGDHAAAESYLKQHIPMYGWDYFKGHFEDKFATEAGKTLKIPARFRTDVPFMVVPMDKLSIDVDPSIANRYAGWRDVTAGRPDRMVPFTQKRDTWEIFQARDVGHRGNPVFKLEPAETVSAIPAMTRALSRITRSYYMEDYKFAAIERWLREADPYLDKSQGDWKTSPYAWFAEPKWASAAQSEHLEAVNRLKANAWKIRQFAGIGSPSENKMAMFGQWAADQLYKVAGPKGIIYPTYMLPFIRDPFSYVRSFAFNANVGLFSIPQFFVHMMTFTNVFGLAGPKYAGEGTVGAFLHLASAFNHNPEILARLDSIAAKMGWKEGVWKEALAEGHLSGFFSEFGQHAFNDNIYSEALMPNKGQQFLHGGQTFFNAGVKSLRSGSWFTAFKEFRDLHPTGALTDMDKAWILDRADFLSHNMSRASSSWLHTGWRSYPAQFYTYFLRLSEIFTGKRIDNATRARFFLTNALIFGLPASLSLTGLPAENTSRNIAEKYGYEVGQNPWASFLMEGGLSLLGAAITGGGHPSEGHWDNPGLRYGPQGNPTISEMLKSVGSDESHLRVLLKMFGGASYETVDNVLSSSVPFWEVAKGYMNGTPPDDRLKLTVHDFSNLVLGNFASGRQVIRLTRALYTHEWMTKNGIPLGTDVDWPRALYMTLTGMQDTEFSNLYRLSMNQHAKDAHFHEALKEASDYWNQFKIAQKNGDNETADLMRKNVKAVMIANRIPTQRIAEFGAYLEREGSQPMVQSQGYNTLVNPRYTSPEDVAEGAEKFSRLRKRMETIYPKTER